MSELTNLQRAYSVAFTALAFCAGVYVGRVETQRAHCRAQIASSRAQIEALAQDKSDALALVGIVDKAKAAAVATCTAAGGKDCEQQIEGVVR